MEPRSNWRDMFERGRSEQPQDSARPSPEARAPGPSADRHTPPQDAAPIAPEDITAEAAMALADDTHDYRPWTVQRGRMRPAIMLHLRRFEPRSGLWMGWQLAYPHLIAVEYTGDRMVSLDFGSRQFAVTGNGLGELVGHLQTGNVLTITEYSKALWPTSPAQARVDAITCFGSQPPGG
jgi:hypothetical protein